MGARIAVGGFETETNSFGPPPTQLEDYERSFGEELIALHRGAGTYIGGMLERLGRDGATVLPLSNALAEPAGITTREAYAAIHADLVSRLRDAMPVDGVALCLHGAALAEGVWNTEVELTTALRQTVGPGVPIVATLDLHGNITQELANSTDLMLGCHEYPHVDQAARGEEAVARLFDLMARRIRPVTVVQRLPMLMPLTSTWDEPLLSVNAACRQLEETDGVLDVTLFHGFPSSDVASVGTSVVATADGTESLARTCAEQIAEYVWDRRTDLLRESLTAAEAVARALRTAGGPVVINETSDNPGGGAPGDGTHLLRAMLEARVERACFGTIRDPGVAAQAVAAGPGQTIPVRLGGKTDDLHGAPIVADAYVQSVSDGRFTLSDFMPGMRFDLGPVARLRIDGVDILVCSGRSQTLDHEVFLTNGINIRDYKLVGLKSSHHFRAAFSKIAAAIVTADPPGLTSATPPPRRRRHNPGPMWPDDPTVVWMRGRESPAQK